MDYPEVDAACAVDAKNLAGTLPPQQLFKSFDNSVRR